MVQNVQLITGFLKKSVLSLNGYSSDLYFTHWDVPRRHLCYFLSLLIKTHRVYDFTDDTILLDWNDDIKKMNKFVKYNLKNWLTDSMQRKPV